MVLHFNVPWHRCQPCTISALACSMLYLPVQYSYISACVVWWSTFLVQVLFVLERSAATGDVLVLVPVLGAAVCAVQRWTASDPRSADSQVCSGTVMYALMPCVVMPGEFLSYFFHFCSCCMHVHVHNCASGLCFSFSYVVDTLSWRFVFVAMCLSWRDIYVPKCSKKYKQNK